ncbi:MAG: hypothetical protein V4735_07665 [Pseudomonadota bacterium]
MMSKTIPLVLCALLLGLGACNKVVDGSNAVVEVSRNMFNDTKGAWMDFLTYHPKQPDPMPQTRYCYQMQSDVVCFDSEQPGQTAKLIGYQDGTAISWVQPGGGSLGASGGQAIAYRPPLVKPVQPSSMVVQNSFGGTSMTIPNPTGQIGVNNLPPVK